MATEGDDNNNNNAQASGDEDDEAREDELSRMTDTLANIMV